MTLRGNKGLPAVNGNTALAVSGKHKMRLIALIGQALDEFEKRKAAGTFDLPAAIADEVQAAFEDDKRQGMAALKALNDLLPAEPGASSAPSAALASLAGVFAGAAAAAAGAAAASAEPEPAIIDVTPRVQSGDSDEQAIDW
jgi:hypothetical protein